MFTTVENSFTEYDNLNIGDSVEKAIEINYSITADEIFSQGNNFHAYIACSEGFIVLEFENENSSELIGSKLIDKKLFPYDGEKIFGEIFENFEIIEFLD